MSDRFDPRIDILPAAQRELWPSLASSGDFGFVLYGGTAVALHLGHRTSIDFDFFKAEPLQKAHIEATKDSVLLVASLEDLLATKLKAILDRAEAKDYLDISAMLATGTSLERALGAFSKMYKTDPALPLRALGFFQDGDLGSLAKADQDRLRVARDRVSTIPDIELLAGLRPAVL